MRDIVRRDGKLNEPGNIVGLLCSTKGLLQVNDRKFKSRHILGCLFQPYLALQVQIYFNKQRTEYNQSWDF